MSFFEGLHAEMTKETDRRPLAVLLFLGFFELIDRVRRRLARKRA